MPNIIAYGGMPSKNSPSFSEESFLLTDKAKFIDGIMVDAYLTSDNKVVLSDEYLLMNMGIDKEYINCASYNDILSINSGSKIKRNHLVLLDKLNEYCNPDTIVLINIIGCGYKNNDVVNYIKNFVSKSNMNIYLYSKSKDITEALLESDINAKIGVKVTNKASWNYSFDFYVVDMFWINQEEIAKKLSDGCEIFIGIINNKEEVNKLKLELGSSFSKCYLVSKSPSVIKNYL